MDSKTNMDTYQGVVHDNGCWYEDYEDMIGDELITNILNKYRGKTIKMTIEVCGAKMDLGEDK